VLPHVQTEDRGVAVQQRAVLVGGSSRFLPVLAGSA